MTDVPPSDYAARLLLAAYPLDASADVEGGEAMHLLVLGDDSFAWAALHAAAHVAHHPDGNALLVTHVVPREPSRKAALPEWIEAFDEIAERRSVPAHLRAPGEAWEVLAFVLQERPPVTGVYVCLDREATLRWARRLRSPAGEALVGSPPLHVRLDASLPAHEVLGLDDAARREPAVDGSRIHVFGCAGPGLPSPGARTASARDGAELDALARTFHEVYRQTKEGPPPPAERRAAQRRWEELDATFKEASRRQAEHLDTKVRGLGLRPARQGPFRPRITARQVERLARAEHARWMAERRMAGWRWGAQRDDTARMHPLLVPYEQLSEKDKDLDRSTIRLVPSCYSKGRRALVPLLRVAVCGPVEPAALRVARATLATELERIRRLWAPCVVSLAGRLGDPLFRAAAEATLHDPDTELELALDRPVGALLGELADPDRRRAWLGLLDRANRAVPVRSAVAPWLSQRCRIVIRGGHAPVSDDAKQALVTLDARTGEMLGRTF